MQRLALLLLLLLTSPLLADEARHWLRRVATAIHNLNYEGVFVYQHGNELEAMRIVHGLEGGVERERLFSLNGEAREVIRDDRIVTCIWPQSHSVTVSRSHPKSPFLRALKQEIGSLEPFYRVRKQEGMTRIANRTAQQITIMPHDHFRYGYRLWLDQESDLPLRYDMLDTSGKPIEVVMFTELTVLEQVPRESFMPIAKGQGFTWKQSGETDKLPMEGPLPWHIDSLPAGFTLIDQSEKRLESGSLAYHQVYSDGLATVSLFIDELSSSRERLQGHSHMGAVQVYGRVVDEHQVIVVGEVPAETVALIGNSIKALGAQWAERK